MKLQLMGGACQRVQELIEQRIGEGALSLPPELVSHAARCPHCAAEIRETEQLLARLYRGAAGVDLSPVPRIVDHVMERTAAAVTESRTPADLRPPVRQAPDWKWALGQIAAVAAVFLIAVGGTAFLLLKVNEAVSGTSPGEVIARLAAPFREFTTAMFRGGR